MQETNLRTILRNGILLGAITGIVLGSGMLAVRTDSSFQRLLSQAPAQHVLLISGNKYWSGFPVLPLDHIKNHDPSVIAEQSSMISYLLARGQAGAMDIGPNDGAIIAGQDKDYEARTQGIRILPPGRLPEGPREVAIGFRLARRLHLAPHKSIRLCIPDCTGIEGAFRDDFIISGIVASALDFPPYPFGQLGTGAIFLSPSFYAQAIAADLPRVDALTVSLRDPSQLEPFIHSVEEAAGNIPIAAALYTERARSVKESAGVLVDWIWWLSTAFALALLAALIARRLSRAQPQRTHFRFLILAGVISGAASVVIAILIYAYVPNGDARVAEASGFDLRPALGLLLVGFVISACLPYLAMLLPNWPPNGATFRARQFRKLDFGGAAFIWRDRFARAGACGALILALFLAGAVQARAVQSQFMRNRSAYGVQWDNQVGDTFLPDLGRLIDPILTARLETLPPPDPNGRIAPLLRLIPPIARIAKGTINSVYLSGTLIEVRGFSDLVGDTTFTILSGRAPSSSVEMSLGCKTMAEVGLRIGQVVPIQVGRLKPKAFTLVGCGVMPDLGGQTRLGRGGLMTLEGLKRLNPGAPANLYLLTWSHPTPSRAQVAAALKGLADHAQSALRLTQLGHVDEQTLASYFPQPPSDLDQRGRGLFVAIFLALGVAWLTSRVLQRGREDWSLHIGEGGQPDPTMARQYSREVVALLSILLVASGFAGSFAGRLLIRHGLSSRLEIHVQYTRTSEWLLWIAGTSAIALLWSRLASRVARVAGDGADLIRAVGAGWLLLGLATVIAAFSWLDGWKAIIGAVLGLIFEKVVSRLFATIRRR